MSSPDLTGTAREAPAARWVNPTGAQLQTAIRYDPNSYNPEGEGQLPDTCQHPWWTAWRWVSPSGVERHWVSAAPASDIVPTRNGFLVVSNWIAGCRRERPPGTSAKQSPWWFIDRNGDVHRLGWSSRAAHRDVDPGIVPCRTAFGGVPTVRYCTFDHRSLTLSPLDFVPKTMDAVHLDRDGRVWVTRPYDAKGGEVRDEEQGAVAWTDDQGRSWHARRLAEFRYWNDCQIGGTTVACGADNVHTAALLISTDRGRSWSRIGQQEMLRDVPPAPGGAQLGRFFQTFVTRSGATLAWLSRGGNRYTLARRPAGPGTAFSRVRIPRQDHLGNITLSLSDTAGVLTLGSRTGALFTGRTTNAGGPATYPPYYYQSRDDGKTWTRIRDPR